MLPPLVPLPAPSLVEKVSPSKATAIAITFATLISAISKLPEDDFAKYISMHGVVTTEFLQDVYGEGKMTGPLRGLRGVIRGLLIRCMVGNEVLRTWSMIGAVAERDPQGVKEVLEAIRNVDATGLTALFAAVRRTVVALLSAPTRPTMVKACGILRKVNRILYVDASAVTLFVAGDDFFDSLAAAYVVAGDKQRDILLATGFLSLVGLEGRLLGDRLFALRELAGGGRSGGFTEGLVSCTPVLNKLAVVAEGNSALTSRLDKLQDLVNPSLIRRPARFEIRDKGKDLIESRKIPVDEGVKVTRLSVVAGVREMLPDLGEGYLWRVSEREDDVQERVVEVVLEGGVEGWDTAEPLTDDMFYATIDNIKLPADTTGLTMEDPYFPALPMPVRKNFFDNDTLDRLSTTVISSLHISKPKMTTDDLLKDKLTTPSKQAIMNALMNFDANDDEWDDTYDANDVGAAVEADGGEYETEHDEVLWKTYIIAPMAFDKSKEARGLFERRHLREKTGMSDEAIEGWAVIVSRSPQLRRKFERLFAFDGDQKAVLKPTKWSRKMDVEGEEHSTDKRRGGQLRESQRDGRPKVNVVGKRTDEGVQRARREKGQAKGKERKQGHTKKMRGGMAGPE